MDHQLYYQAKKAATKLDGINTWACFIFIMLALIAYDIDRIADRYAAEQPKAEVHDEQPE